MKFFTALLVLALAGTYVSAVEEDVAVAFIECVRKAFDGGLPEAQIVDHNPFLVPRNTSLNFTLGLADVLVQFYNYKVLNIPTFKINKLVGEYINDDNTTIKYNYSLIIEKFRVEGNYALLVNLLELPVIDLSGSWNHTGNHFELSGSWTQTTAGPKDRTLDELKLIIKTGPVDVEIGGLLPVTTEIVKILDGALLKFLINTAFEIPSLVNLLSNGIATGINEHWLAEGHRDKIDAIIANCQ